MNNEIYIDGKKVDAPAGSVALNFSRGGLGEITFGGSGSQTLSFPDTPTNSKVFENSNLIESESEFPYTLKRVYWYSDGILLFDDGELTVLAHNNGVFECAITWGNAPLIQKLKNLYMCEVPLGVYRKYPIFAHVENFDERMLVESCLLEDIAEEGVIQEHRNTFVTTNPIGLNRGDLPTATNLYEAITKVLSKADPSVYLSATVSVKRFLSECFIPMTTKEATIPRFGMHFEKSAFNVDLSNVIVSIDGMGTATYGAECIRIIPDNYSPYQVDEPRPDAVDDPAVHRSLRDYYIPESGWYDVTIEGGYTQTGAQTSDFTTFIFARYLLLSAPNTSATDYFYIKAAVEGLADVFGSYKGKGAVFATLEENVIPYFKSENKKVYLTKGKYGFWFACQSQTPNQPLPDLSEAYSYEGVYASLTIAPSDGRAVKVTDEQQCFLDSNFVFGDITAHTFLTETFKAFGVLAELREGTLELYTYSDMADGLVASDSVDWSNAFLGRESVELNYEAGNTKTMRMEWAAEEQYNGYADGEVESLSPKDLTTQYISNDLYSQGSSEQLFVGGYVLIAPILNYVKMELAGGSAVVKKEYNPKLRIVKKVGSGLPENPDLYYLNTTGDLGISNVAADLCVHCRIAPFQYGDPSSEVRGLLRGALNNLYRVNYIKLPIYLQPKDVAELSFQKPVYLKQFGAYFSIEKIKYIQGGTSYVELLKINS